MLQIEHIYTVLFKYLFNDFYVTWFPEGFPKEGDIDYSDLGILTTDDKSITKHYIHFYDQEPLLDRYLKKYEAMFERDLWMGFVLAHSEKNKITTKSRSSLYYFFHGFAALDWFRGHQILNFKKTIVKKYNKDYVSFNRLILNDRSYRINLLSHLIDKKILDNGVVSFNVSTSDVDWKSEIKDRGSKLSATAKRHILKNLESNNIKKLVIDKEFLPGSVSADILRPFDCPRVFSNEKDTDAFWHVVTETVFYYPKLHLTEKIFKPIVSKQPFMLLAAPGNLEYLRSYGFKTFAGIIDESYDDIKDNDARIEAVVAQLKWYCDLSDSEKTEIQRKCEPIVEHNFHHFYGKFREIITDELLDNTKKLFEDIGYDDANVDYATVRKLLIS